MTQLPPPAAFLSRPDSISDLVYAAIRDAIVERQFAAGERVTEAGLAKWLNVSKTPVREAMLRLQEVGLVEADAIRGSRVVQPSDVALRQAFEIREALEVFAAERAAETLSDAERSRLTEVAKLSLESARAGDVQTFRDRDREFHRLLTTGNPRMQKLLADTGDFLRTVREQDVPSVEDMIDSAQTHVVIANAVSEGDSEAASREMRKHIRAVRAHYSIGADA